jgi:hypothetical protein
MQWIATRMVYNSIDDEEQSPREEPFLVVTEKSWSRREMVEGGVEVGWKRMPPWAYVAFWWDLGCGKA